MDIFVYSKQRLEGLELPQVPHLIVSITCPGDPKLARIMANERTLEVLRLAFHDLCDEAMNQIPEADQYEAECFNRSHARRILALLEAYPTAQCLIVSCDAGLSRSPGVAAALTKILGGDDSCYFKRYTPNSRVYRTLLEEHHAPGEPT